HVPFNRRSDMDHRLANVISAYYSLIRWRSKVCGRPRDGGKGGPKFIIVSRPMPVRILSCLSYSEYRLLQLARDVWARYRHGAKVPPARHSAVEEYLDALASVLHRKYRS